MNKKLILGLAAFIGLIITATVWTVLHNRAYIKQLENDLSAEQKMSEDRDKPKKQVDQQELDTSHPDFHIHEDGTPHIGTHDAPAVAVPFQPSVPSFSNFTPDPNDDPVTTAYKRLEYIKNNPHEWGDLSPRTLELMDEMTPMLPMLGEGENIIAYLADLAALRDPRSAELLLTYQLDSGVSGRPVSDALVAMGPAAVPGLIVRLEDISSDSSLLRPMKLLDLIIAEHRADLGGIVEHIIIPKLAAIAASNSPYSNVALRRVAELQQ